MSFNETVILPMIGAALWLLGLLPAIIGSAIKNKKSKAALTLVSLAGWYFLAALLINLANFDYTHSWLPAVPCGVAFLIGLLFIWRPFTVKTRRIITAVAITLGAAAILFGIMAAV